MNLSYLDQLFGSFLPIVSEFFNSDYVIFLGVLFLVVGLIRVVLRWSM